MFLFINSAQKCISGFQSFLTGIILEVTALVSELNKKDSKCQYQYSAAVIGDLEYRFAKKCNSTNKIYQKTMMLYEKYIQVITTS